MPPARRRRAHKAKTSSNLSLGDLVLAKVKGFPAWPAKISRPEDWEKLPDPKKFFVQFFGTMEIAFVAPADIQAFTNESKTKLTARCQGKTKYFTQAVKEICAAFDELEKQKADGLRDDTDNSCVGSEAASFDGLVGDLKDATDDVLLNIKKVKTNMRDVSNLEHCTQRCGETEGKNEKPSVSGCPTGSSSPLLSPVLESKSSIGTELNRHASNSVVEDQSRQKMEASNLEDVCNVSNFKQADNFQSNSTNVNKTTKLVTGSRRSGAGAVKKRNDGFNRAFLRDENSAGDADISSSRETMKGGKRGKIAFSVESDSADALKSDSDINSGNKDKTLPKTKPSLKVKNELGEFFVDAEEADRNNSFKKKTTQVLGKRNLGTNETLHATKKLKCMDAKDNKNLKSHPEVVKSVPSSSPDVDDKAFKKIEIKRSISCLKTEKGLSSRGQTDIVDSDYSACEVLTGAIHHSQVQQARSHSASLASGGHAEMSSLRLKGESNDLAIKQVQRRSRTVRIYDDGDNDDEPKTPVHGRATKNAKSPCLVSDVMKSNDTLLENGDVAQLANRKPTAVENSHLKKPHTELYNDSLSTGNPRKEKADEVDDIHLPHSPNKLDSKQFPSKMGKLSSISPVDSDQFLHVTKSNAERHKSSKPLPKDSSNVTQKKTDNRSSKSLVSVSTSKSQVTTHKITPKTLPQAVEVPAATENLNQLDAINFDRFEMATGEKSSLYIGSSNPETAKTMKHLIAAAQAKRKLVAQFQCQPLDVHNVLEGTPSPSMVRPFMYVSNNFGQEDLQGDYEQPTLASPLTNGYHSTSQNPLTAEENEEIRAGSGQEAVGGSLSGGTEAAIARDTFEAMIETLSRTKESIGRATRLAIDCAKYGIANQVVELLIRKLENETSFHRKVDLFFLVDSITQRSHIQKGIAGASYIPTVQGGLSRLLGAAAPPGVNARENRRQCLKVLRLWLERKIFPESLLRRYMDDIGGSNDNMTARVSFRRPSRAERSLDDPIRELDGMLVDEYGSNITFQLPGLLSFHVIDEDEDDDFPGNASFTDPTCTLVDSETSTVTPSDKRHRILEDVDGELEMEDVSGHPKFERPVLLNCSLEMDLQLQGSDRMLDPPSNISAEVPVILEGSPPLPLDSPPLPPPLPSSPPPPPLSPSPPPPLPSQLLQPAPASLPLPCQPSVIPQPSGPAQPSIFTQVLVPSQSSHQSSPPSGYQQPHDCSGTSGNQTVQMAGNSFPAGQNVIVVKNETMPQQPASFPPMPPASFPPMPPSSSQEPSALNPPRQMEYGQNNLYLNCRVPQHNQQFQLGNPPLASRHMHPTAPQNPSNQYSYPNPSVQQHIPHSFHPQYSLPSVPDGQRQFVANEQWRSLTSEPKMNNQQGSWRGVNPSCPGPPFGQEGYFRPPLERPPISNVGFQHVNPNKIPAPPLNSGYGVPQMLPCRPDIPALNCWRPT